MEGPSEPVVLSSHSERLEGSLHVCLPWVQHHTGLLTSRDIVFSLIRHMPTYRARVASLLWAFWSYRWNPVGLKTLSPAFDLNAPKM